MDFTLVSCVIGFIDVTTSHVRAPFVSVMTSFYPQMLYEICTEFLLSSLAVIWSRVGHLQCCILVMCRGTSAEEDTVAVSHSFVVHLLLFSLHWGLKCPFI